MAEKMSIKYDWYQTDKNIVIRIKNLDYSNYEIIIEAGRVQINSNWNKKLDLELLHPIVPFEFEHTDPNKEKYIVIILSKKTIKQYWVALEKKHANKGEIDYYANQKKWREFIKADEERDGDSEDSEAELRKMFHKIYERSDDNVKRAMNKSFTESEGTSLSTNWEEVSKGKVKAAASNKK